MSSLQTSGQIMKLYIIKYNKESDIKLLYM